MAKERVHELKQTQSAFQVRGIVSGVESKRFYESGTSKNGGQWNKINFGVKIASNKTVYITLNGFPRKEVFYYKRGENGSKGVTEKVAWKDRKKAPGAGFRLIGVNISTGKDENGKNINEVFTEFDAVEWLHENLKDGDSLFIKGSLDFNSYTDRNGQTKRNMNFVPNQISYTQKPVDFDAEDYIEMAEFENTLVFNSIDKETDENDKTTGRFILTGYSIGYNTIENVSFIIDEDHAKLAGLLKKNMKPGYAIKTYGKVNIINDISVVEEDDSGWGETSPMERVNSPVIREYVVYKADPNTIEKDEYSEDSIAAAIRKIKAAKTAAENFGEKESNNDVADWGAVDEDGDAWEEDIPWED